MQTRPLDGVERRLEELLVRVLLTDVLLIEALLCDRLKQPLVTRLQVLLCKAGIEDEGLVLEIAKVRRHFNKSRGHDRFGEQNVGRAWLPHARTHKGLAGEIGTHPIASQHPPCRVHPNSCYEAGLHPQEAVVQQRDLRKELAQRPRLDVVVVRLADLAHPAVR